MNGSQRSQLGRRGLDRSGTRQGHVAGTLEHSNKRSDFINVENFLTSRRTMSSPKRALLMWCFSYT